MGVFGVAQTDQGASFLNGDKPQVTSDGKGYLYICARIEEKTQVQNIVYTKIYKIGSGEHGTIPGKIY